VFGSGEEGSQMHRAVLIGPVVWTLVGSASGLCAAMLSHRETDVRAEVKLEESTPLLADGALIGCLVGLCVLGVCSAWPRALPAAEVLSMTVLGAALAAPLGWVVGDSVTARLPSEGMAAGAAAGAAGGLVLGVLQRLSDWRKSRA
jgi:hypothetical protein